MGQWIAQFKFNGSRNLIHITPERKITFWTRHQTHPARFTLTDSLRNEILSLNLEKGKEYWLDGELMNKTIAETKNKIILYDVLCVGKYLFQSSNQVERLTLLNNICNNPELLIHNESAFKVSDNIWMANTFENGFVQLFSSALLFSDLEGLVLKKKISKIDNFGVKEYEVNWLIRCRKPNKSYNF